MKKAILKIPLSFRVWIAISVVICAFSLLSYSTSQQVLRQSANDPQIQMAEDAISQINSGKDPKSVILSKNISLESLDPFVVVLDSNMNIIASEANIQRLPLPPKGVFEFVKKVGFEWFTWQPQDNVRIAATLYYDGKLSGFILAGRNLREIEKRENRIFLASAFTWVAAEAITLVAFLVLL